MQVLCSVATKLQNRKTTSTLLWCKQNKQYNAMASFWVYTKDSTSRHTYLQKLYNRRRKTDSAPSTEIVQTMHKKPRNKKNNIPTCKEWMTFHHLEGQANRSTPNYCKSSSLQRHGVVLGIYDRLDIPPLKSKESRLKNKNRAPSKKFRVNTTPPLKIVSKEKETKKRSCPLEGDNSDNA